MIRWLRANLDPDELLVVFYVFVVLWRSDAAWFDLVGKPRDAPHLQIDPHLRALLWAACGVAGIIGLQLRRGTLARMWLLSPLGVGGMFSFVLGSYLASWVTSWGVLDRMLDDDIIKGDPHAWGSIPYYLLGVGWAIIIMLAPWDWSYFDRSTKRPGRLEKRVRD